MKNHLKIAFGIIALVLVVVFAIVMIKNISNREEPMIRTGQIEMREYDVSSKIPGRVEWIKFDEGDIVAIGQDIFKLTDREVRAKVAQAAGAVESAQAQYDMVKEGSRKEQIEMAERKFIADKSQFELAEKTFSRMKNLHNDKLISDQEFDVVEQKYKAARAAMDASAAQLSMAKTGARNQEKRMAAGQYNRATQAMEEAKSYLDEAIVKSPWGGIISKRYVDVGELVATGYPVVSIVDTTDAWAELNLPANELEKMKIGMIVKGRVYGIGSVEQFKVVSFSAMADFANWRATNDKGTFDVRSFTVKLVPINKNIPSLRPGMTVTFDLNKLQ
jgi:HlyD family secretion protein